MAVSELIRGLAGAGRGGTRERVVRGRMRRDSYFGVAETVKGGGKVELLASFLKR
jgi:hypothetical protein